MKVVLVLGRNRGDARGGWSRSKVKEQPVARLMARRAHTQALVLLDPCTCTPHAALAVCGRLRGTDAVLVNEWRVECPERSIKRLSVALEPLVVGSDCEGSLDELSRLRLIMEGVAAEERVVAEGVDVLRVDLQRCFVHVLGRLVLTVRCFQQRAVVAEGVDMLWVGVERALIHALGALEVAARVLEEEAVVVQRDGVSGVDAERRLVELLGAVEFVARILEQSAVVAQCAEVARVDL